MISSSSGVILSHSLSMPSGHSVAHRTLVLCPVSNLIALASEKLVMPSPISTTMSSLTTGSRSLGWILSLVSPDLSFTVPDVLNLRYSLADLSSASSRYSLCFGPIGRPMTLGIANFLYIALAAPSPAADTMRFTSASDALPSSSRSLPMANLEPTSNPLSVSHFSRDSISLLTEKSSGVNPRMLTLKGTSSSEVSTL